MKSLLINLILCTFLISCGSPNKYLKEYRGKNYSCNQVDEERIKFANEMRQYAGKQVLADKVCDYFVDTWSVLFLLRGGDLFSKQQDTYLFTGLNQEKLKERYEALEDLAIEKNCPSKDLILKRRQMIERSIDKDGRIDSR